MPGKKGRHSFEKQVSYQHQLNGFIRHSAEPAVDLGRMGRATSGRCLLVLFVLLIFCSLVGVFPAVVQPQG